MNPWKVLGELAVLGGRLADWATEVRQRRIRRRIEDQRREQESYNDEWARKHKRGKYAP